MTTPRRAVRVPSRRGDLRVIYRPAWITVRDYDDAERDPKGTAARLILSCVARWSLAYHDGERVPINQAAVAELNGNLVLDIAKAIIEDYRTVVASEQGKVSA